MLGNRKWRRKFGVKPDQAQTEEDGLIISDRGAFKVKPKPKVDTQIFKVQRPLFSSGDHMMLIYNEDKSWFSNNVPFTPDWQKLFGVKMKIYVIATPDATGLLNISHVISDQDW